MEVHLPCPPLSTWLPVRLAGMQIGCWGRGPRRVRATLARWPSCSEDEIPSLDALLFGIVLERPAPPEQALARLRPGSWIVELAVPRRRVISGLLGLEVAPLARAKAGQARALAWLARGYHQLEQWQGVEPHDVIVTLARVRRG